MYSSRLSENTVEEMKYYCGENKIAKIGTKKDLIKGVEGHLRKRKLEVVTVKMKKARKVTVRKAKVPPERKIVPPNFIPKPPDRSPASISTPVSQTIKDERKVFLKKDITRMEAYKAGIPPVSSTVKEADF